MGAAQINGYELLNNRIREAGLDPDIMSEAERFDFAMRLIMKFNPKEKRNFERSQDIDG